MARHKINDLDGSTVLKFKKVRGFVRGSFSEKRTISSAKRRQQCQVVVVVIANWACPSICSRALLFHGIVPARSIPHRFDLPAPSIVIYFYTASFFGLLDLPDGAAFVDGFSGLS
jgi:hypothetical protein